LCKCVSHFVELTRCIFVHKLHSRSLFLLYFLAKRLMEKYQYIHTPRSPIFDKIIDFGSCMKCIITYFLPFSKNSSVHRVIQSLIYQNKLNISPFSRCIRYSQSPKYKQCEKFSCFLKIFQLAKIVKTNPCISVIWKNY